MTGTLEDLRRDMEHGVYDFTENGECVGCGKCCSNLLPMTKGEVAKIHDYIKKNGIKKQRHLIPLANSAIDMTCPFLDNSKSKDKCVIYEARPAVCREFICNPSKRKEPTVTNAILTFVREEFFKEG